MVIFHSFLYVYQRVAVRLHHFPPPIRRFFRCCQDLKVFAMSPQGFALAYGSWAAPVTAWICKWHQMTGWYIHNLICLCRVCMNMYEYIKQMEYILYIYILIHTNHPWMVHFTRAERHEIVGSLEHPGTCLLSRSWVYAWTCCKTTALDGAMIMCRTYPFLVKLPWGSWGCCGPTVATCRPSKGCWILVSENGVPKNDGS